MWVSTCTRTLCCVSLTWPCHWSGRGPIETSMRMLRVPLYVCLLLLVPLGCNANINAIKNSLGESNRMAALLQDVQHCSATCSGCPAGLSCGDCSDDNNRVCKVCSEGEFSALDAHACEVCGAGKTSAAGSGTCDMCPPGRFSSTPGAAECQSCEAGATRTKGGGIDKVERALQIHAELLPTCECLQCFAFQDFRPSACW